MSRTTRRIVGLVLALGIAGVVAPAATPYPDSYQPEFRVSSGLASKMQIEERGAAQVSHGPKFVIEGSTVADVPVQMESQATSAGDSYGGLPLLIVAISLAVGAALVGALALASRTRPRVAQL